MIVITAPTSQVGSRVVTELLGGARLRFIVRDAAELSDAVRDQTEVVEGSHGDALVTDHVFEGRCRVLGRSA